MGHVRIAYPLIRSHFVCRPTGDDMALIEHGEPIADIRVRQVKLTGVRVPPEILARMARWTSAEDQLKEGIAIAQETIARVRSSVRGLQLSAPLGQVELLDSLLGAGVAE